MIAPFNKWSIRIVTVLIGIAVLTLAIVRLMYPSLTVQMTAMQSVVTTAYVGYIGAYVGYDWGVESIRQKQKKEGREA